MRAVYNIRNDDELAYVFNGALVADGVEPGDLDGVRRQLASARYYLALGLEYAAQGDAARGAQLLLTAPIARIFQVASGLTLKRKFRADRLVQGGFAGFPGAKNTSWFDAPVGAAIEGLRRKRPQLAVALERDGGGHELRRFRSRKDSALVDAALERARRCWRSWRSGWGWTRRKPSAPRRPRAPSLRGPADPAAIHLALQGRGKPVDALVPFKPKAVVDAASWALAGGKASPELERRAAPGARGRGDE